MCWLIIEVFVKLGHLWSLESGLTVPVFEEGEDATRVYDLIRGAEREIQESRDGYRGNEVAVGQSVAGIVNVVQGKAGQIEVLLWADDVDIFPVV